MSADADETIDVDVTLLDDGKLLDLDEPVDLTPDEPDHSAPQPVDDKGVPLDVVEGQKFLQGALTESNDVSKAEELLKRNRQIDQGAEDSDEEFDRLLEEFGLPADSLTMPLNERRNILLENMDDTQLARYEFFRRSNLNTGGVRKFVNNAISQNINPDLAKIIAGVGKVFVGEIVEKAKDVQLKEARSQVAQQISYKWDLKEYEEENADWPGPTPDFYEALRSSLNPGVPRRHRYTYNSFQVIVPDLAVPLTPDHIRIAWMLYQAENRTVVNGRWRQQGGGKGLLFR